MALSRAGITGTAEAVHAQSRLRSARDGVACSRREHGPAGRRAGPTGCRRPPRAAHILRRLHAQTARPGLGQTRSAPGTGTPCVVPF